MELPNHPYCGVLLNDDTVLCVGCEGKSLGFYSLEENPLHPVTIRVLSLQARVTCLSMLTPDMLLCGQRFGCLNLVSLDSNYTS
jgi:hypothetical protein